jgi:hypothetical protein
MGNERSDSVWSRWAAGSEKFDYFIVGISSALAAYLGQHYLPAKVGLNPATLELAAILSLSGSVVVGLKRIEQQLEVLRLNHLALYHGEAAGALTEVAGQAELAVNTRTGELLDPASAGYTAGLHKEASGTARKAVADATKTADSAYHWRNRLLYLGFALFLASRLWRAYTA